MSAEAILRHSQKLISNAVAAHRYNTADLTSMNNGSIPVLNEIDPTYHLACMFLRANIPTFLETTRVSLAAAIKNDFATEREFAEIAMSDELANVVVEYRESLSRYVNKLCNISSETLIEAICNDAKTLKYSVLSDIPPSTEAVANLDTTVHVVNAELLEEALNLIRDSEDRLYVAYTERGDFSLAINIVLKYDALSAWWRCICSQAMDTIEQMVVHAFLGEKVTGHIEYEEPTYCGTVGFYPPGATAACIKNPYHTWSMGSLTSTELRDPITGKQITRQVYWKADAYQDFLALVSDDRYIPDFLKSFGFATTQSFGYGGNSNIRLTDPTCRLQLPFEYGAQGYSDREKRAYRFSWLYPTRVNSIKQLKKKHNL